MSEPTQAYGYIRVPAGTDDVWEFRMELVFVRAALMAGFQYVKTFREQDADDTTAFGQLIDMLRATGAHHVFVPTLSNLAPSLVAGKLLTARLRDEAGASLVVMDPAALPNNAIDPLLPRRSVCVAAQRTYFHY